MLGHSNGHRSNHKCIYGYPGRCRKVHRPKHPYEKDEIKAVTNKWRPNTRWSGN